MFAAHNQSFSTCISIPKILPCSHTIFITSHQRKQHGELHTSYLESDHWFTRLQAPKSLPPAAKQKTILDWIQRSGVAHTIRDLEKHLPSIASINGMAVKEYIQALSDENAIRIEKIGSGNWYWCFMSDEKLEKETALNKAREERDKVFETVESLQIKVEEAGTAREEDDDDMLMESGNDRKSLMTKYAALFKEMETLRTELASYNENNPVEVERRKEQIRHYKLEVEKWTDQIQSMEAWVKKTAGADKSTFMLMKRNWYGDEFDEEEGGLKEF
jgi:hypothetical protein